MRATGVRLCVLIALVALAVGLAGCSKSIDPKLTFSKGEKKSIVMEVKHSQHVEVGGMKMDMPGTEKMTLDWETLDVDASGNASAKVTFASVTQEMNLNLPGVPADLGKVLNSVGDAMKGQSVTMAVSPKGAVSNVQGLDALQQAVEAKLELPDMLKGMKKQLAEQVAGQKAMTARFEQVFSMYPDGPVAPGQTWTRTVPLGAGAPADATTVYTLKEVQDSALVLDEQTTYKGSGEGLPGMGADVKLDVSGTGTGSVELDRATGWPRVRKSSGKITGNAKLGKEGGPINMDLALTIDLDTTVEVLPR